MCHEAILCDLSVDTEWKSELVNSRNFDQEIGHQNPRYRYLYVLKVIHFPWCVRLNGNFSVCISVLWPLRV